MRTEQEIRQQIEYYKDLKENATAFSDEYFEYLMLIRILTWVLGENNNFKRV